MLANKLSGSPLALCICIALYNETKLGAAACLWTVLVVPPVQVLEIKIQPQPDKSRNIAT